MTIIFPRLGTADIPPLEAPSSVIDCDGILDWAHAHGAPCEAASCIIDANGLIVDATCTLNGVEYVLEVES